MTYPDSDHEFTEINLTTAILVKEIEKNSNLLWVQVDSHLAQTLIQLLRVNLSVVVLVEYAEYLSDTSDGKSASLAEHCFDLIEEFSTVI